MPLFANIMEISNTSDNIYLINADKSTLRFSMYLFIGLLSFAFTFLQEKVRVYLPVKT